MTNENYPLPSLATDLDPVKWPDTGEALIKWASDDTFDIQAGVDAQIRYLQNTFLTPNFGVTGQEKDFVGACMRHKVEHLVRPGDKVTIINNLDGPATLSSIGQAGTVGRTVEVASLQPGRADAGLIEVMTVNDGYFYPHHLQRQASTVEVPVVVVDPKDAEISRLRRLVQELRAEGEGIIEGIGEEAERRDWCSEYEEWTVKINSELSHFYFEPRLKEFEVTIQYTVSDSGSRTYTISAQDEDSALADAQELFDNEDATDLWSDANGDYNTEVNDTDVSAA